MSESKFELKILQEEDGQSIDMKKMSLKASKAFSVLLSSLMNIAQEAKDDSIKIEISSGSIGVSAFGSEHGVEVMEELITEATENGSKNKIVVEALKKIQSVISANGLMYQVSIVNKNQKKQLTHLFKTKKQTFKHYGSDVPAKTKINFIEGKLMEAGGKKPNIHVLFGNTSIPVDCSEKQARSIIKFLYKKVYLSVYATPKAGGKTEYKLCDYYIKEDTYASFKEFITYTNELKGTEPLNELHIKIRDLLSQKKFGIATKLIRLFCYDGVDRGRLRAILIITKAFRGQVKLEPVIQDVIRILEKKVNKPLV